MGFKELRRSPASRTAASQEWSLATIEFKEGGWIFFIPYTDVANGN